MKRQLRTDGYGCYRRFGRCIPVNEKAIREFFERLKSRTFVQLN